MGPEVIFYTFLLLMLLVLLRVHIGIALCTASFIGVWLAYNDVEIALSVLSSTAYESIRCLLYTSPSPRDATLSRMPSSA